MKDNTADLQYAVQTSPHIRAYFDLECPNGIIVDNLFSKRRFNFSSTILLEILKFCTKASTLYDLKNYFQNQLKSENLLDIIEQLIECELLTEKDKSPNIQELNIWCDYGWKDALDYYLATYNYPFLSYEEPDCYIRDKEWMRIYKEEQPPPPIYKDYNDKKAINLLRDINALDNCKISDILGKEKRISCENNFSAFEKISHLLLFTFGETGRIKFPNQGAYILKTSPSGGARHPTEAYLCVLDSSIIGNHTSCGIFHYSVRDHALHRLPVNCTPENVFDTTFELKTGPQFPVKAILILSSVVERSMWRYREPRSYRVILNDIGHLNETLKMVAAAVGIKIYPAHGYKDSQIENLLDLDSLREPVMQVIALC